MKKRTVTITATVLCMRKPTGISLSSEIRKTLESLVEVPDGKGKTACKIITHQIDYR